MSSMESFPYIFIQRRELMNNSNKVGNWQWDQGWEDQKDVRGEVWRTLDRLQFERVFPIRCMYTLLWQCTALAEEIQLDSPEPSVSLPSLHDLIPLRFPTACQSFAPTIEMGRGFCGVNTLYDQPSCRYLFCLELQNWGNILMRTRGGQHLGENNDRCSSTV